MKWVLIAIVIIVLLLAVACFIVFDMLINRKELHVPEFLTSMVKGNVDPREYDAIVQKKRKELLPKVSDIIALKNKDGMNIIARMYEPETPSKRFIVACHGVRSSGLTEFALMADFYRDNGYNLLLIDHRACGESGGKYMGYGYYECIDTQLWIDYILKNYGDDCLIYLHGVSMGAASVLMMSDKTLPANVKGIIADCPYTSAWDEFAYQMKVSFHLPQFPILHICSLYCKLLAGYSFKEAAPIESVKNSKLPILFIHGESDDFVPFFMGEQLYEACTSQKRFLPVKDALHARSYHTNTPLYEKAVLSFIEETENDKSI